MVFLPYVSVLSIAAAFWQGQAAHERGLRLHHGRNRGPNHATQGSAVLELGGTSHLSVGSASTSATSSVATSSGQKLSLSHPAQFPDGGA